MDNEKLEKFCCMFFSITATVLIIGTLAGLILVMLGPIVIDVIIDFRRL